MAAVLQFAKAQEVRNTKSAVVLLADRPKAELDALVSAVRTETASFDIMAREGRPHNIDDLELVNAKEARTIIVMDPGRHIQAQVCDMLILRC